MIKQKYRKYVFHYKGDLSALGYSGEIKFEFGKIYEFRKSYQDENLYISKSREDRNYAMFTSDHFNKYFLTEDEFRDIKINGILN